MLATNLSYYHQAEADWKQHSFDEEHSGFNKISVNSHEVKWVSAFDVGLQSVTDCSPLIHKDTVFIAHQKTLYAMDIRTGAMLWNYSDGSYISQELAFDEDIIVVGMWNGYLYGIDKYGKELWQIFLESPSATIFERKVYSGAHSGLYCLDLKTGVINARYNTVNPANDPAIQGNNVIFGTNKNCEIHALDMETFNPVWIFPTSDENTMGAPAIYGDQIFVSSWKGDEVKDTYIGTLTAISKDGILQWNFTKDALLTKPIVANEMVFVGMMDWSNNNDRDDLEIFALNATNGEIIWRFPAKCGTSGSLSKELVYFGVLSHSIIALDQQSGELVWRYGKEWNEYAVSPTCSPAISHESVFMGGYGSELIRFGTDKSHESDGESPWDRISNHIDKDLIAVTAVIVGLMSGKLIHDKIVGRKT